MRGTGINMGIEKKLCLKQIDHESDRQYCGASFARLIKTAHRSHMKIAQVDIFALKIDYHYSIGGHQETPGRLPGTDYYIEPQWPHAYSRKAESCIVKLTTECGLVGWGEGSAPLVPETPASILANLVGPALIGQNPLSHEAIYERLIHLMDIRGHTSGFMMDAIAASDIAVWDLRGRHYSAPISELLGGPMRARLPAYVSGLRQPTWEEQCKAAADRVKEGFAGVKIFTGKSLTQVQNEFEVLREVLGRDAFLALDLLGKFSLQDAIQLGHILDNGRAAWLEAPLNPDDIDGHALLARATSTPVAIGEHLRSVQQFMPWIQKGALRIAQPDVPRTGITAAKKIADIAHAYHLQVALHFGLFTGVGLAATCQVAASLPNFLIQEHQYDLFGPVNQLLEEPLDVVNGEIVVPTQPGLGISVNESKVKQFSTEHWIVDENGKRPG